MLSYMLWGSWLMSTTIPHRSFTLHEGILFQNAYTKPQEGKKSVLFLKTCWLLRNERRGRKTWTPVAKSNSNSCYLKYTSQKMPAKSRIPKESAGGLSYPATCEKKQARLRSPTLHCRKGDLNSSIASAEWELLAMLIETIFLHTATLRRPEKDHYFQRYLKKGRKDRN